MILNFVKAKYKFRNCIVSIKSYSNSLNFEHTATWIFLTEIAGSFTKVTKESTCRFFPDK